MPARILPHLTSMTTEPEIAGTGEIVIELGEL
jgi:hypothetical protein